MPIPFIIAYILLGVMLVQDVRSRAIWWFLPPLLFADLLWLRWEADVLISVALNLTFVLLIMGLLVGYVAVRFGNPRELFSRYFGLGDFLFLLAITPLCAIRPFILLFTIGTLSVLLLFGIVSLFKRQATIPYAGYFSLAILVYVSVLHTGTDLLTFLPID